MRPYSHTRDRRRYDEAELDPCLSLAHTQTVSCCICRWGKLALVASLLLVMVFGVVVVLNFFLTDAFEQTDSDVDYVHYDIQDEVVDSHNEEFGTFGVKMDSVAHSHRKLHRVESNKQLLLISPNRKQPEWSSKEAFYRSQVMPRLRPNPLWKEIPATTATLTARDSLVNLSADSNLTAENALVEIWTTTSEHTVNIQTTAASAPTSAPLESAEVSKTPIHLLSSAVKSDCSEAGGESGIYLASPDGAESFLVYCDQESANGGWTVIQKRVGPTVYFYNRTWQEYEEGFGDIEGSHWLGLMNIHRLTSLSMDSWILRIEIYGDTCSGYGCINQSNGFWWAEWPFKLGAPSSKYVLELGPAISGNLTTPGSVDFLMENNGNPFTTIDKDNDAAGVNCAQFRNYGGWWHTNCGYVALNGLYGDTAPIHRYMVYTYSNLKTRNKKYFIHPKKSVMMIRPRL